MCPWFGLKKKKKYRSLDERVLQFYMIMVTSKGNMIQNFPTRPEIPLGPFQRVPAACFPREVITSDSCIACSWSSKYWIILYVLFGTVYCCSLHEFEIHPSSCVFISFHSTSWIDHNLSVILLIDSWGCLQLGAYSWISLLGYLFHFSWDSI